MSAAQFSTDFSNLVNAGFPYVYIPSYEEERIVQLILRVAEDPEFIRVHRKVYEWTQTGGLTQPLNPQTIRLNPDEKKQLVRAALGLTLQEAENAFCRAIVRLRGLDISALSIIHEEKNQAAKKAGLLEFVKSDLGYDDIGGLENLKKMAAAPEQFLVGACQII